MRRGVVECLYKVSMSLLFDINNIVISLQKTQGKKLEIDTLVRQDLESIRKNVYRWVLKVTNQIQFQA